MDSIENYAYEVDYNTTAEIVVCVFPSLYGHGIVDSSGKEINDIVQLGVYLLNDYPLEVADGTQVGIGKKAKTTASWYLWRWRSSSGVSKSATA